MGVERDENQERDNGKKRKKSWVEALFAELVERLKELEGLIKARKSKGEPTKREEEEKREIQEIQRRRIEEFKKSDFGQQTTEKAREISQTLDDAFNLTISPALPAERQAKLEELKKLIDQQKKNVVPGFCAGEPDTELLQGIAQAQLEDLIEQKIRQYNRVLQQNNQPEAEQPTEEEEIGMREIEKLGREVGKTEPEIEQAKKVRRQLNKNSKGNFYYYNDPEFRKLLQGTDSASAEAREAVFDDLMATVDSMAALNFHEAMDLSTMNKLAEFRRVILNIGGQEGQRIVNDHMTKTKMRMMNHNAVWLVEQGAGKPDDYQKMMEQMTPELFDALFKYEGVDLVARLYEVGIENVRSQNNNFAPYRLLAHDPKAAEGQGRIYIDEWVRERFEETLKAKMRAKNPDISEAQLERRYKADWPENKIRRAMSLGKGFEMTILRIPEMVARGRLPPEGEPGQLQSPYGEDFVRPLDPFEHFIEKFLTGDPGAMWMMYTITEGQILPGSSRAEIEKHIKQSTGVDSEHLRMVDVVNFLEAGGPFTQSTWRGNLAVEGLSEADQGFMGLSFRINLIKKKYGDLAQTEGIETEAGREDAKAAEIRSLFEEVLEYNPVRILLEAELHEGEILDPDVRAKVIRETLGQLYTGSDLAKWITDLAAERKPGESKEIFAKRIAGVQAARKKFFDEVENPLIVATQLAVSARRKQLDLSFLPEAQRKKVEAYRQAIKKVVTEPNTRKWTTKIAKKGLLAKEVQEGSLLDYLQQKDYPFSAGLDDVPWDKPDFISMGQKGFSRRMRDYAGASHAMMGMLKLENSYGMLRNGEDYVKVVEEIWQAIREYDKPKAQRKVAAIYKGICEFNAGNNWRRYLPMPLGWLIDEFPQYFPGFIKQSSYAKQAFGPRAASWRAVDIRNFLYMARAAGHISREQEAELKKQLRCTPGLIILEYAMRMPLLGGFIVLAAFIKELLAQLEDQAKQT